MYINSQSRFNAELISLHFNVRVIAVLFNTEYTEWKRDFDVYWRIMKLTADITKKYFCLCLILSDLFIYVLLIFRVGFYTVPFMWHNKSDIIEVVVV